MLEPYRHRGIKNHEWGQIKTVIDGPHYSLRILTVYPNNLTSPLIFHHKTQRTIHTTSGFLNIQIYTCIQDKLSTEEKDWGKIFDYILSEGMSITINPYQAYKFWAWETTATAIEASCPEQNDIQIIANQGYAPELSK